jgi:hypothetical protein
VQIVDLEMLFQTVSQVVVIVLLIQVIFFNNIIKFY